MGLPLVALLPFAGLASQLEMGPLAAGVGPRGEMLPVAPEPRLHPAAARPQDEGARRRRRLSAASYELCPNDNGVASGYGFMTLSSSQGINAVALYNNVAGYAGNLFCQWKICPNDPTCSNAYGGGDSGISLVFDNFDVPVGFDVLKVYQLKCNEGCTSRSRTTELTFPSSFADMGLLPPLVFAQETEGFGVQILIRFLSTFASGSSGFIASYAQSPCAAVDS